jgi:hypothetical protein
MRGALPLPVVPFFFWYVPSFSFAKVTTMTNPTPVTSPSTDQQVQYFSADAPLKATIVNIWDDGPVDVVVDDPSFRLAARSFRSTTGTRAMWRSSRRAAACRRAICKTPRRPKTALPLCRARNPWKANLQLSFLKTIYRIGAPVELVARLGFFALSSIGRASWVLS